jgi:hypothetical protein
MQMELRHGLLSTGSRRESPGTCRTLLALLGADRDAINRVGGPIYRAEVDAQRATRVRGRVPVQVTAAGGAAIDEIVERVETTPTFPAVGAKSVAVHVQL